MSETIHIGDVAVALTRKDVIHVHLSVHPPSGRVTLVAPRGTRPEVARAYVATVRDLAKALGISDVRMEEGSLRADVNLSLRAKAADLVPDRAFDGPQRVDVLGL